MNTPEQAIPFQCHNWAVRRIVTGDEKPRVEVLIKGCRDDNPQQAVAFLLSVGQCEALVSCAQKALEAAKEEASR